MCIKQKQKTSDSKINMGPDLFSKYEKKQKIKLKCFRKINVVVLISAYNRSSYSDSFVPDSILTLIFSLKPHLKVNMFGVSTPKSYTKQLRSVNKFNY